MDRKMVSFIKEQYPSGTRIQLNSMEDPYAPLRPVRRAWWTLWMTSVPST